MPLSDEALSTLIKRFIQLSVSMVDLYIRNSAVRARQAARNLPTQFGEHGSFREGANENQKIVLQLCNPHADFAGHCPGGN